MNTTPHLFALVLLAGPILAQTFGNRTAFLAAGGGSPLLQESFNGSNGSSVPSLFSGLITFPTPVPTIFRGGWRAGCGTLVFSGGGLIPAPRYGSRSLVMPFSRPVYGIGAQVFDDYDGNPFVSTITLTVTTTAGTTISVAENCNAVGDVGFLGVITPLGIMRAEFSLAGSGGNLEIDELAVFGLTQASATPYGQGCSSSLGVPALGALNGSRPVLGTTFQAAINNVPGTAVIGFGASNTSWGGLTLPFDGAALGAPGCILQAALESTVTTGAVAGTVSTNLTIPNQPALIGAVLHAQGVVLDPAANAAGVAVSNPLLCVLGT
ncbi:MAG: hypothetical protein KDC98_06315 [Planctomycetes bacterium]|nr:hypothetical protein [Planctomycetota bacterium]